MGSRGPLPKRSGLGDRRTQANKIKNGVKKVRVKDGVVKPPPADSEWHPIARSLWQAVKDSKYTIYYEPSDWLLLYDACDELSSYKYARQRSAMMRAALNNLLSGLLLTEGDRRRARIEIDRDTAAEPEESAGIVAMRDFLRKRASGD